MFTIVTLIFLGLLHLYGKLPETLSDSKNSGKAKIVGMEMQKFQVIFKDIFVKASIVRQFLPGTH